MGKPILQSFSVSILLFVFVTINANAWHLPLRFSKKELSEGISQTILTFDSLNPICLDGSPILLDAAQPIGGDYSGLGVENGYFDSRVAGVGTHIIRYAYEGQVVSSKIKVLAKPKVRLEEMMAVDIDTESFPLLGGFPFGGVYSGEGVVDDEFYPVLAGEGLHQITYSYHDGECFSKASAFVEINSAMGVALKPLAPICKNLTSLILSGGTPAGGIYFGEGVVDNVLYLDEINANNQRVYYTVLGDTVFQQIQFVESSQLLFEDLIAIDEKESKFPLLGAFPAGGSYVGMGVTENVFDPLVAGVGEHLITYSYTDKNGCSNHIEQVQIVNSLIPVYLEILNPICENAEPFLLEGGMPKGGTYNGQGVTDNRLDPSTLLPGEYAIDYEFKGVAVSRNIRILEMPHVFLPIFSDVNINDGVLVALDEGFPKGGEYEASGIINDVFDPELAGVGIHEITYTYKEGGCHSSVKEYINVVSTVVEDLTFAPMGAVCFDGSPFRLHTASPEGGVYSGDGIGNNTFSPKDAGIGIHKIVYTYGDEKIDQTIEVKSLPDVPVIIKNNGLMCNVYAEAYVWSLDGGRIGASARTIDPGLSGAYQLKVTVDGCTSPQSKIYQYRDIEGDGFVSDIEVNAIPNPTNGSFIVQISKIKSERATLYLYDPVGIMVLEKELVIINEQMKIAGFDLEGEMKGVYLLKLQVGNEMTTRKLVFR